jgi:ELWxxDGT repeat protein
VKDIDSSPRSTTISGLRELGGMLLFSANDGVTGPELWRSDGTDAGTVLVKDIWPGAPGSEPEGITTAAGLLFFFASDGKRSGLWRSDGTPQGTFLLKEGGIGFSHPHRPVSTGGLVFFRVLDGTEHAALWRSDGTVDGTFSVLEASSESSFSNLAAGPGGLVFFNTWDSAAVPWLWRSDGTVAGTLPLKEVRVDQWGIVQLATLGALLIFVGDDGGSGYEAWRSDGTPNGTFLLKDIRPGSTGWGPVFYGEASTGLIFSVSYDDRWELWRTDGTSDATVKVKDFSGHGFWGSQVSLSGKVLFPSSDLNLVELHVSDGTPEGTYPLAVTGDAGEQPHVVAAGGLVFFRGDIRTEIWRTDGTLEGTLLLEDMAPDMLSSVVELEDEVVVFAHHPTEMKQSLWRTDGTTAGTFKIQEGFEETGNLDARLGGSAFFMGNDGSRLGLWKTDGTTRGTVLVTGRFGTTNWSDLLGLTAFQGRLFFGYGRELWTSDGSPEGTVLVKEVQPGTGFGTLSQITATSSLLFFTVSQDSLELWRSDGTPDGTRMVLDVPKDLKGSGLRCLTAADDLLFFFAGSTYAGAELWRSDGTPEGTFPVKKIGPCWRDSAMAPLGKSVCFFGADGGSDFGLWRSGGTEDETMLLATFCPPYCAYFPEFLAEYRGSLYFISGGAKGAALWKTDGTLEGTLSIADVEPISRSRYEVQPKPSAAVAGSLLFFTGHDEETGTELWKSDGTAGGTALVKDIWPGRSSSHPTMLVPAGNVVFFFADDGERGRELWRSDGTEGGTFLVEDVCPGTCKSGVDPGSEEPLISAAHAGGELFFSAYSPETGRELWRSDGTPEGTRLAADIYPGPEDSMPGGLVAAGGFLYFGAVDPIHGGELRALELEGSQVFRRGDANADGRVDLADALALLSALFRGGPAPPCPDAADADDDGRLAITDAIHGLQWLFQGGLEPPSPGPETCGPDGTGDGLGRCAYETWRC